MENGRCKYGQRYNGKGRISSYADYIQLDICGLRAIEIVQRYFLYDINKPILLLGDYTNEERKASEDDMLDAERLYDLKDSIKSLRAFGAELMGLTMNPVSREGLERFGGSKFTFREYVDKVSEILQIPVLVKNTANKELLLSEPEELIEFSKTNKITLDHNLLIQACNYSMDKYLETFSKINIENIQESYIRTVSKKWSHPTKDKPTKTYDKKIVESIKLSKSIPWATFVLDDNIGYTQFDSMVKSMIGKNQDSKE
ncbi:hypothetical protein [Viridibacillus arvi]|uniref:hypothetical protein n=1 Tax=Viridibacillus arvi TaxID=263475 RepID=UPI0034CE005A